MASGEAFGAVHRRSYRRSRPGPAERGLPRFGVGFVSSPDVAGPVGLRVRDGNVSSRKLERATYRLGSVSVHHGERSSPTTTRSPRFSAAVLPKEIEELFVEVLQLAREMGVLKMGIIGLDGTKIHANASRHSALSYEHVGRIEAQLKAEVADLLARAEAADAADVPDGMSIPDELARREERLSKLAEAKAKIEARAKERHAREMAEHQAKMASREAKTAATGKKPGGRQPQGNEEPTWRILGLLAVTVGVPFLLLSATSPFLQTWYQIGRDRPRPYRLYALSNLGSLWRF